MSAIARKINIGLAAGAMAAAATLTPITVAQAQPVPAPMSALGGMAGGLDDDSCVTVTGAPCASTLISAAAAGPSAAATPGSIVQSIFQNDLWWIGRANPNPPARADILVFTPLSLVPGFLKPAYSWFTQNLDFEACFLGATVTVGPYGTTSLSVGRGCN